MKLNKEYGYWFLISLMSFACFLIFILVGSLDQTKLVKFYYKIKYHGKPASRCKVCKGMVPNKLAYDDGTDTWICHDCFGRYELYLK